MTQRIIVDNISKKFQLGQSNYQSWLENFFSKISGKEPKKTFWALKNISFTAEAGEIIGIIGANGAGKSTLLKIIAGIYRPNGGEIKTAGKMTALINTEAGLKFRLTMRENIYLCCSFFGLKVKEVDGIFNQVVQMAELEKYVDTKLYQFSSGMIARLIFSITINAATTKTPDIILIDEALAAGDEQFKIKSLAALEKLKEYKATILFITHELPLVIKHADRAIWINDGQIVEQGEPAVVVENYKNFTLKNKNQGLTI